MCYFVICIKIWLPKVSLHISGQKLAVLPVCANTMRNVHEKCSWMCANSNSLGGHAVLLLTCPVLLTQGSGDLLFQGLHTKGAINRKKASHATLCSICA